MKKQCTIIQPTIYKNAPLRVVANFGEMTIYFRSFSEDFRGVINNAVEHFAAIGIAADCNAVSANVQ